MWDVTFKDKTKSKKGGDVQELWVLKIQEEVNQD